MTEQRLRTMMRKHKDALASKQQFSGLLKDCFPSEPMIVNLMVRLYEIGIFTAIEKTDRVTKDFRYRFVQRLADEYGIDRPHAEYSVDLVCVCYGKEILGKPCDLERVKGKGAEVKSPVSVSLLGKMKKLHLWYLGISILFLSALRLYCNYRERIYQASLAAVSPVPAAQPKSQKKKNNGQENERKQSTAITVKTLADEFAANAIVAEAKYKEKRIIVTGSEPVITEGDQGIVVMLGVSSRQVAARFPNSEQGPLAKIGKGQRITFEGSLETYIVSPHAGVTVFLSDCKLATGH